jgi:MurNAc alpha-1-phosphate uridylyltransferase
MSDASLTAMVLAAGLGRRLGEIGTRTPKPLIRVGDKTLLDHVLDELAAGGVKDAVVNVHHLAPKLREHLGARTPRPHVTISDETDRLMDTGGGVAKALPLIASNEFVVAASDVIRRGGGLEALFAAWNAARMDILMLLHPREIATGFDGAGDFFLNSSGRPTRRGDAALAPFVYAGLFVCHRRIYADVPAGPFSNNLVWDRVNAAGRLFGLVHEGDWFHVGTPAAITLADDAFGD